MNNITTLKSSPSPAGSFPPAAAAQSKSLKNVPPLKSVNNENCSPNIGRRASHSKLSEKVLMEVQEIQKGYLKLALEAVSNGGNCQTAVDKYCIKNRGYLNQIHAASLKANMPGSAGAMLREGEKWQTVADKHGIRDENLSAAMKTFSACMDKKQVILKDVPADDEKYDGSADDEAFVTSGNTEDKTSGTKPGNYRITSLDAVLAYDEIISLADK